MYTIYLKENSGVPYYEQIYRYIKEEIRDGNLPCHTKLPSSRGLAGHLEVSRSTVDNAYAQLQAEGYIESVPKKGYYVCQVEEMINIVPVAYPKVTRKKEKQPECIYDFSPTGADYLNYPKKDWKKLEKECINDEEPEIFRYSEPEGDKMLRESIRNYLHQNRGVNCESDNIIIGAGNQYLMMLLSGLLGRECTVAMENPVYMQSYRTFHSLGHKVVPVSVDKYGISAKGVEASGAGVVYVTPAHQFPLGIVMPVSRRMQLLNWANYEPGRYIIEDDYDSEFRYHGKPIPALQSMDKGKKVIYMGTFSKVLSPAVRMSYMVLPDELMDRYRMKFGSFPCTVSRLEQRIMTKFIQEGFYERHLNRLRNRYKTRHDRLISELKGFENRIQIGGTNAGSYIVIKWLGSMSEKELYEQALHEKILVYPIQKACIEPEFFMEPVICMGFAHMSQLQMKEAVDCLKRIWK